MIIEPRKLSELLELAVPNSFADEDEFAAKPFAIDVAGQPLASRRARLRPDVNGKNKNFGNGRER